MATETIPTTATHDAHDAHLRDAQELAQAHGVDPDTGLHADEAILSYVSPVIGCHVGPGTLSIAYMAGM